MLAPKVLFRGFLRWRPLGNISEKLPIYVGSEVIFSRRFLRWRPLGNVFEKLPIYVLLILKK